MRERDLDIGWAVETVLRSELFFSDENIGTRVAGPIDFVLAPVRALQLFDPPPSTLVLAEWASLLGHDLFYPPNVGGWNEGRAWLSTRTLIGRANFAAAMASGRLNDPPRPPNIASLLEAHGQKLDLANAVQFIDQVLLRGRLPKHDQEVLLDVLSEVAQEPEVRLRQLVALLLSRPEAQLC